MNGHPRRLRFQSSEAGLRRSRLRITALSALVVAVCFVLSQRDAVAQDAASVTAASSDASNAAAAEAKKISSRRRDPQLTMGVLKADCKKCHPSEVAAWQKTTHFQTADLRLYGFDGNTKKYADALKISRQDLLKDSMCADCHGTKAPVNGQIEVVSGVSCESCHGASGGSKGWLNRHQSYHDSQPVPRQQETAAHRQQRIAACETAGMIRADNLFGQTQACFKCHIVTDGDLIAAGHKMSSAAFEFVSWSEGEIRHNFLLDRTKNAKVPSLWLESHGGQSEGRQRMKFVLGVMAQLEATLRARASATNPVVIPKFGGSVAAINAKLTEINAMANNPETTAITLVVTPLFTPLFTRSPKDPETFNDAADKVAEQARNFAANHDGSKLPALDAMIQMTPPHFSQQFRQKYLRE